MALEKEKTVSTPPLLSSSSPSSSSPSTLLPTRPKPEDSPSVVREYLAAVLRTYHDVSEDTARGIASAWRYGRGSELGYYDVQTFRDMFGSEAGNLLYGHARGQLKTSPGARVTPSAPGDKNNDEDVFGLPPGLFFVYFFFVSMILTAYKAYACWDPGSLNNGLSVVLFVISSVSSLGFMFSYLLYYRIMVL